MGHYESLRKSQACDIHGLKLEFPKRDLNELCEPNTKLLN